MMFKFKCLKKNYFTPGIITFSFLLSMLVLTGCDYSGGKDTVTFFGGKIKNPKDDYVYFSKGMEVLDSARLDVNNKFSFQLDSLELGLYTFKHGAEFQYLYLEPQDSLLLYLNTWDFDESLIFSGKGSAKNNYLINLWLQQERNEKAFKSNYKLDEAGFSKVIDEGIKKQLDQYNKFLENQGDAPSPYFDKLVKAGIYYPFYYFKEMYPRRHQRMMGLKEKMDLSEDFYSYRDQIDINDKSLLDFGFTPVLINTYLYNIADEQYMKDPEQQIFEITYMNTVIEKIQVESFKNSLLAKAVWSSLSNKNVSDEDSRKIHEFFYANCSDEKYKVELKKSIAQKEKIKCGEAMPKLTAYSLDDSEVEINDLIKNSGTVIYFWPEDISHVELLTSKLKYLEKKHPNIVFIGIERSKSPEEWRKFIKSHKLSKNSQFRIAKNSEIYSWYEGDMARTIVVNSQGRVENGFLFFNDSKLDYYLKTIN